LNLSRQGKLIRLGYGLYAKARPNRITGLPMIAAPGGFDQVAKEALSLLGVKWQPSIAEQNYNARLTTQIPVNTQVLVMIDLIVLLGLSNLNFRYNAIDKF
jgi:hypothetical protein